MNTSPPNKLFADSKCLTPDQMKLYHEGRLPSAEKHEIENHLLDCELCSEALSGFALLAITPADIEEINKRTDALSGAQPVHLWTSKLFIAAAAVVMISVSFFFLYRSFFSEQLVLSEKQSYPEQKELFTSGDPPKNTIVLDTKNEEVKKLVSVKIQEQEKIKAGEVHPNEAFTMEMLEMKSPDIILSNTLPEENNVHVPVLILGNDTFILDLKITDYDKYYFVDMDNLRPVSHNTDPMFENQKDRDNSGVYKLQEWEVTTTAQVLQRALVKFNAQQYEEATKLFNVLVKHNGEDVNALFYGGVCYFNLGNTDKALDYFTSVMSSSNGSFYEEAKWYKALSFIKKQDKEAGQKLLKEIVSDNGFYKERAKEKLKAL